VHDLDAITRFGDNSNRLTYTNSVFASGVITKLSLSPWPDLMSASATWLKNAKGFVNVVPTVIGRGSVVMQMRPIITLKQSKAKTAKHVTNKSLLTHFFTVSIGRTKSITDPAPTANDLEQRRHRRDRCIRLLGVLPRQISWVSKCCFIVLPRHERPN
jgi:hypothetical protein